MLSELKNKVWQTKKETLKQVHNTHDVSKNIGKSKSTRQPVFFLLDPLRWSKKNVYFNLCFCHAIYYGSDFFALFSFHGWLTCLGSTSLVWPSNLFPRIKVFKPNVSNKKYKSSHFISGFNPTNLYDAPFTRLEKSFPLRFIIFNH